MSSVRLILALHNHQPVGNFDGVFAATYRDSYGPFLDVMESYPEIPFALHTSGPLLEWLVANRPEYIARLKAMVAAGRVEILGGAFYEPILTMIPARDRVGQIRRFSEYQAKLFDTKIRGMWIAERVWEQSLVGSLVDSGIEYTLLDDFHFQRAGVREDLLFGHFLTEDEGKLLKLWPISERMRYQVPFQEPHASYEYLRQIAEEKPGSVVVVADDGEKFGGWPKTFDHVYTNGWLRRFCDMLMANLSWIDVVTPSRALETTIPVGKVYLPDCSYREMTEWALPTELLLPYQAATAKEFASELRPFVRAGGSWRNFKVKYPETDEMYARMLGISKRLAALEAKGHEHSLDLARDHLYRGQCNCPYWHGSFGGLYLPHLRHAIHHHLIAADNALDLAEGKTGPRVALEVADFNLDARQEVRLENETMIVHVRPALGGHIYALDARDSLVNLLGTLDRRPEPYHDTMRGNTPPPAGHDFQVKDATLVDQLIYDRFPRKTLVDHFYSEDVSLADLIAGREVEHGDFATGTYLSKIQRGPKRVALIMDRPGRVDQHTLHIRKTVSLDASSQTLDVLYTLEELPQDVSLHFAVEINVAGMAGHAHDRFYADLSGEKLGTLDSRLELDEELGIQLSDAWLDLGVKLEWSQAGGIWCFPIETVSQSEAGIEGVYQSSAVLPHWHVEADSEGRWEVRIRWTIGKAVQPSKEQNGAAIHTHFRQGVEA